MIEKILVIDPDALVRDSMSLFLEDMGCGVMTSGDAGNASRCLSENDVDVVVCARHLPDMDGLDFLRRIRTDYPELLKVIECDPKSGMDFFDLARTSGAHEVLHKPYTAPDVEKMIFRLNRKRLLNDKE